MKGESLKIRNWILGCAGVASLGAVWIAAAGRKPAGSTPGEMPFRLGRVQAQDLQVNVREAGVVDPATKVDVKAAVSGRVVAIKAREGDRIRRGQVLAEVEPDVNQAQTLAKDYGAAGGAGLQCGIWPWAAWGNCGRTSCVPCAP